MSSDSVFGEATEPMQERRIKVIWPLRSANVIEGILRGAMTEAMALEAHRAPFLFIGDDEKGAEEYEEIYGERFTVADAIAMQAIVYGEVQERYRRCLIVARELGEHATMADYLIACEAEGIKPLIGRNTPNEQHHRESGTRYHADRGVPEGTRRS
jgi:hypothetical protein